MYRTLGALTATALLLALTLSCSSEGDDILPDVQELAEEATTTPPDTKAELSPLDTGQDVGEDFFVFDIGLDLHPLDGTTGETGVQPGGLGFPCNSGDQCDSGFCIFTPAGKQCTIGCLEDCPMGWECVQHQPSLPDEAYICAPLAMNLCKPCKKNSDCLTNGVDVGDVCIPYGPAGNYCGSTCMGTGDCPSGYDCKQVLDVWGQESNQCVLEGEECPCQEWFVDEQAATVCQISNDFGVCDGERLCTGSGLTACDATVPAKELCNGVDDNCDGQVDEEAGGDSCYIENQWGACSGIYECTQGELNCDAPEPLPEACDGKDNDCDGLVDEDFPDSDQDGMADCLENDKDGDGVLDFQDNCLYEPNPDQADYDLDTTGDACDPDDDNDLTADELDCGPFDQGVYPGAEELCNGKDDDCDGVVDEGFNDNDSDALADCIDDDDDNDGFVDTADCGPVDTEVYPGADEECDGIDNDCDFDIDEGFADNDLDGVADCVDGDLDGDEIPNGEDNCPALANLSQDDLDGDGTGDICDPDVDGDAIPNGMDLCPLDFNPGQKDLDGDGIGDVCDDDIDGDAVMPEEDNCPLVHNPEQEDQDEDGVGDACDNDADGDGDPDDSDCAPDDPYVSAGAPEECDGLDNNCNGAADEGFNDNDLDGIKDCVDPDDDNDGDSDATDCESLDPDIHVGAAEKCNNIDDNCNDEVDEDLGKLACGKGVCFHTVPACLEGVVQVCDPLEGVTAETCDGLDNDCDGQADEDLGWSSCGMGACNHTAPNCAGGVPQMCDPMEGAEAETCDGQDNDCDGKVDEELGSTTCGVGICLHTVLNCIGGVPQVCNAEEGAVAEICDGLDNNCDGVKDEGFNDQDLDGKPDCVDLDDDGDGELDITDCAPLNADIHTGAIEACDGVDNNCAAGIDEEDATGCTDYYLDQDGDGHGMLGGGKKCLCWPQGLYKALVEDDCQDLNPWVFPGATELCDGVDNDCDDEVDEPGATGCSWFYTDPDMDGYGSGEPACVCEALGAGWSVLPGDCNEENSDVHPGALELCDGLDNDCDQAVDETYDLTSDKNNCGECGKSCEPDFALGQCVNSECNIADCFAGYDDCDEDPGTGCEVNTNLDVANCGECKKVCNLPNAESICTSGTCTIGECDAHYMDDDGIAESGCEEVSYGLIAADPALTCLDLLEFSPATTSGAYWLDPDQDGSAFQTWCEMNYDGGGWTLIEMQAGNTMLDGTYWSPAARNPDALAVFGDSPNVAARLSAIEINAIFKYSDGHVQHRYNNNAPGYMLTDVFGSSTPSIISGGTMDIAKALRGESGKEGGFCDFYGGTGFKCCNNNGAGMDWRRYNSYKSDNLWCTGVHTYSNNGCATQTQHGPLGDSYGCNKGGQRSVEGHMWWEYAVGGTPCSNYSGYGCYGSRWIR